MILFFSNLFTLSTFVVFFFLSFSIGSISSLLILFSKSSIFSSSILLFFVVVLAFSMLFLLFVSLVILFIFVSFFIFCCETLFVLFSYAYISFAGINTTIKIRIKLNIKKFLQFSFNDFFNKIPSLSILYIYFYNSYGNNTFAVFISYYISYFRICVNIFPFLNFSIPLYFLLYISIKS